MPTQRMNLGSTPRLVIVCNGDLDIRGSERSDTTVETDTSPFTVSPFEGGAHVESPASCVVRMPEGGHLEAGHVPGDLRIRGIAGEIILGTVGGSCYARHIRSLKLGQVIGEMHIRDLAGTAAIGQVHGCLMLHGIAGPVQVETVNGDISGRAISAPVEIGRAYGSLALRTGFETGTTSRFDVQGEAVFWVPVNASVRFILPAESRIALDKGVESLPGEGSRVVQFGDAAATVYVTSAHSIAIRQQGEHDEETTFTYTFSLGADLSEHLADISAELETQFSMLETHMSSIPERVRSQVEKRLHSARRQVEAAQRRVEREMRRAQREAGRVYGTGSASQAGQRTPAGQPVTEEEWLRVLRMLEEGKINVQEAEQLLAALEGRG